MVDRCGVAYARFKCVVGVFRGGGEEDGAGVGEEVGWGMEGVRIVAHMSKESHKVLGVQFLVETKHDS